MQVEPDLEPTVLEVVGLSTYAWIFRYPGHEDLPSLVVALDRLRRARALLQEILKRLPREAHP